MRIRPPHSCIYLFLKCNTSLFHWQVPRKKKCIGWYQNSASGRNSNPKSCRDVCVCLYTHLWNNKKCVKCCARNPVILGLSLFQLGFFLKKCYEFSFLFENYSILFGPTNPKDMWPDWGEKALCVCSEALACSSYSDGLSTMEDRLQCQVQKFSYSLSRV